MLFVNEACTRRRRDGLAAEGVSPNKLFEGNSAAKVLDRITALSRVVWRERFKSLPLDLRREGGMGKSPSGRRGVLLVVWRRFPLRKEEIAAGRGGEVLEVDTLFRICRGVVFGLWVGIIDDSWRGVSTAVLDNTRVGLEVESSARVFFCGGWVGERGDEDEEGPLDRFRFKNMLEGIKFLIEELEIVEE